MALFTHQYLLLILLLCSTESLDAWVHSTKSTNQHEAARYYYASPLARSTVTMALSPSEEEESEESDKSSSRLDPAKLGFDTRTKHNHISSRSDKIPKSSILARFTSPRVDDPYLPLSDVLVAQIAAPGLQVVWLSLNHAPSPSWIRPFFGYAGPGSLLAPTLIHGAALASCFVVGALAARAYELDAIVPRKLPNDDTTWDYTKVISSVLQAGAFATGVLIMGTQFDLYTHLGYVQLGDSPETDFRLQVAVVELTNDIVFEAVSLLAWRLYLAKQGER